MSETKVTITVRPNGSLRVEGEEIVLLDHEGKAFGLAGRTAVSLCRCGLSANKPFCDGAHRQGAFSSECHAVDLPPPTPKA